MPGAGSKKLEAKIVAAPMPAKAAALGAESEPRAARRFGFGFGLASRRRTAMLAAAALLLVASVVAGAFLATQLGGHLDLTLAAAAQLAGSTQQRLMALPKAVLAGGLCVAAAVPAAIVGRRWLQRRSAKKAM